ncbi:MAG: aconitate hydratase, partial [Candidatus Ancillula sp.]|nr:aconitate hydratase [Candidatus Ancillula sp.]
GTFANIRLNNKLVSKFTGSEKQGGWTVCLCGEKPKNKPITIFDASECYKNKNIPLIVIAGKEYGTGSSRDWAAKGTLLLGVKAVFAESFERIHRSNLIGMGVLPLQFKDGETSENLGLKGDESFDIIGIEELNNGKIPEFVHVVANSKDGNKIEFDMKVRIDTEGEANYFRNGGILQYVLRSLL